MEEECRHDRSLRHRCNELNDIPTRKDLIVLVADTDARYAMEALLDRPHDLGIRPIRYEVRQESDHDPACRVRSAEILRPVHDIFDHALVVFDYHGCSSSEPRERVQQAVTDRLRVNGWGDRAIAIVIEPELEAWAWGDPAHLAGALGWKERSLAEFLTKHGLQERGRSKPIDLKKALKAAVWSAPRPKRRGRRKLSARVYRELAAVLPVDPCPDPSFQELRRALRAWFPSDPPGVSRDRRHPGTVIRR